METEKKIPKEKKKNDTPIAEQKDDPKPDESKSDFPAELQGYVGGD